jgi:hypothetical protein
MLLYEPVIRFLIIDCVGAVLFSAYGRTDTWERYGHQCANTDARRNEALTKSMFVIWVVTPCVPVGFGGMCCLHLQGWSETSFQGFDVVLLQSGADLYTPGFASRAEGLREMPLFSLTLVGRMWDVFLWVVLFLRSGVHLMQQSFHESSYKKEQVLLPFFPHAFPSHRCRCVELGVLW